MAELAHYSPEDVTILVAGFIPITGLVSGTFVSINKNLQPFVAQRTTDGQVARLKNNDQTYSVTLTLQSTSESNDVLTKLWQFDELLLKGKFPLLIKDNLGSSLFFSATTWIESVPVLDFSDTITNRMWMLRSSQAGINFGGNANASGMLEDLFNTVASIAPGYSGLLNGI